MLLYIEAYHKKGSGSWQRARFIAYTTYCSTVESKGRVGIYEFMPLPDDPTPKEVERIKAKEMEKQGRALMREHAKVLEELKKGNHLKIN